MTTSPSMTAPGRSGGGPATRPSLLDRAHPSMEIRRYAESDFAAVTALWDEAGISVPYNDPAREIPLALASPNAALFIGESDGELVATILAGHDGHRGWLYKLAVSPARRHQGLGRRLVAHAEAWLAGQGMPKNNLLIRDPHAAVRDFFRRPGLPGGPRIVIPPEKRRT